MDLILEKFNLGGFGLINNLANRWEWLDSIIIFLADRSGYLMILLVLWLAWRDRANFKKIIIVSLGSALVARYVVVEAIRYFIYSPRPFTVLENVNLLIFHEPTSSFPSGHASFFFALAFGTSLFHKKIGSWLMLWAVLIGIARIYVGVHWPLDVVAGIVVGALVAKVFSKFYR